MVESSDLSPDDVKSAKLVEASNATEKAPSPSISSRPIDVDREGSEAGQGGLVDFGDETDLSNPQNWSPKLKWSLIVLVSLLDFAVQVFARSYLHKLVF